MTTSPEYSRLPLPGLFRYCHICQRTEWSTWYGVAPEFAMSVEPQQREIVVCDFCGCSEHGDMPKGVVTSTGRSTQRFIRHQDLARAWVRYNSRSGKTTERQELRVMRQLSVSDLERMLGERGVAVAR